jgi:hypothetical protein
MSTIDGDPEAAGHVLAEHGRLQLQALREFVRFLASLAQPRGRDGQQERATEVCMDALATCLPWLEGQIGQVLDGLSGPAGPDPTAAARRGEAEPATAGLAAMEEGADEAGACAIFGMTLDQAGEISRLLDRIRAHGDVMATHEGGKFADRTLSILGDAIFDDASQLGGILREVEAQRLGPLPAARTGVREARAVYHAPPVCSGAGSTSRGVRRRRHASGGARGGHSHRALSPQAS